MKVDDNSMVTVITRTWRENDLGSSILIIKLLGKLFSSTFCGGISMKEYAIYKQFYNIMFKSMWKIFS